jgi:4-hydroxy-3-polyprenylbenzoate decarboxylase/2,5-furandicarboxylate decarboxylase 1
VAFKDMRDFLDHLESSGSLVRIRDEVAPEHELAAYLRKASDMGDEGPALLFENIRGHEMRVAGGLFANRRLMLEALETTEEEANSKYLDAIDNLVEHKVSEKGPCNEVVRLGEKADLTAFPFPTYCELDGGPFITLGIAISRDPEDGGKNASIYRHQVLDKRRLGVLSPPPHHLGVHYKKAEALGEPLELAIALGVPPSALVATQWEAGYGVDELTLAGALMGEPLEVVKCRTVDLEVPAGAEIIIEGRMLPGVREHEGPFGEYTGYYTRASDKPVMEVSAITHRRNPILLAGMSGVPTTDNHVLKMIPMEASCYAMLKRKFAGIRRVHFHGSGGVGLMCIVAMKQYARNEARQVLATLLGSQGSKLAVVVDEDIDIHDMDKVMWAICTRAQAQKDVMILPNMTLWQLDPSAPDDGSYSVMGIDATRPFGEEFEKVALVPGVQNVPDF